MWWCWKTALVTKIVGWGIICPIHPALSLRESCDNTPPCRPCESYRCGEGGQFHHSSDPPLDLLSEPQRMRASIRVNGHARSLDQKCVGLMVFTVWQLNRSFPHQLKEKYPHFNWQSNVTGPDNSNVVTGSIFGNLYEEEASESLSVILSALPTLSHFCP